MMCISFISLRVKLAIVDFIRYSNVCSLLVKVGIVKIGLNKLCSTKLIIRAVDFCR